jgi:hypothetical protein
MTGKDTSNLQTSTSVDTSSNDITAKGNQTYTSTSYSSNTSQTYQVITNISTTSKPPGSTAAIIVVPSEGNVAIAAVVVIAVAIIIMIIIVLIARVEYNLNGMAKSRKLSIFDANRRSGIKEGVTPL